MNNFPTIQLNWFVLVLLIFFGFFGIKVFRKAVRQLRAQSNPLTTPRKRTTTLREVFRCWVAPTGVMAIFAALSGEFSHEFEKWLTVTPDAGIAAAVESGESQGQTDDSFETDSNPHRPGWIDDGDSQTGEIQHIVLSSGLWATEAEASRELLPRAASIVRTDFSERHQGLFDQPGRRFLNDERLAHIAVKRQYLERVTKETGSIVLPMCRLWQQIEVSPMVRTEIYPAWKSAVLGKRVVFIGIVLSLITLMANVASLFVTLKRMPHRSTIYACVVAASAAGVWTMGDLLLAIRLLS